MAEDSQQGEEIKPCPFHRHPSMVEAYEWDLSSRWVVGCGACGSHSGSCKTREEAIKLWNDRERTVPREWWDRLRSFVEETRHNFKKFGGHSIFQAYNLKEITRKMDSIENGEQ